MNRKTKANIEAIDIEAKDRYGRATCPVVVAIEAKFSGMSEDIAIEALRLASHKLPTGTRVITKETI